uniref:Protein kinase domain-containing protein n=1 Tax=Amphimedon queenslandica TaxID=400682 RepID=A0A1X7T4T1_AMPQE
MSKAEEDIKKVVAGTEYPVIEEIALKFKPKDTVLLTECALQHTREQDVAVKYSILAREHKELEQELLIFNSLQKHDNIAVLLGTGPNERFIIREFAPYSLETVLHGSYPHCYTYEYNHVMHWARQTAVGLEYIHSKGFLCPGIKPSNYCTVGKLGIIFWG